MPQTWEVGENATGDEFNAIEIDTPCVNSSLD